MKIVAIGKFPGELGREKFSNRGFARSSRAHEENNHENIRGLYGRAMNSFKSMWKWWTPFSRFTE